MVFRSGGGEVVESVGGVALKLTAIKMVSLSNYTNSCLSAVPSASISRAAVGASLSGLCVTLGKVRGRVISRRDKCRYLNNRPNFVVSHSTRTSSVG